MCFNQSKIKVQSKVKRVNSGQRDSFSDLKIPILSSFFFLDSQRKILLSFLLTVNNVPKCHSALPEFSNWSFSLMIIAQRYFSAWTENQCKKLRLPYHTTNKQ